MRLRDVQSNVRTAILEHPSLAGATVVIDDGTGEKAPGRAAALKSTGFCILVWRVESGGVITRSRNGALVHAVSVFVFVEEDPTINRGDSGFGVQIEDAVEYVQAALSGKEVGPDRFQLDDPPDDNLGKVNGVNRWLVAALTERTTTPIT